MMPTAAASVRLRVATPEDAKMLSAFAARLFEESFGPQNRPEDMATYLALAFGIEQQKHELSSADWRSWLAEDDSGALVGYAQLRRGVRNANVIAAAPVEISRVYVDRRWHGAGVAAALMSACLRTAREWGADVVWLGVWERNPRAIAFYEKQGFRRVGTQSFLLGADRQTDHVMAIEIARD